MAKPTVSGRFGSLGSGALTGAALAVQTGLAAVVGIVLAREFGRGAETDGFFAAYGVFIVIVLAAGAIRKLPLTALAVVIVQVPLAWTGNVLFGVTGLALALAASTGLAVLAMLAMLEAVRATVVGVGVAAIKVAVVALVAFIPVSLVLSSVPAAVVGTIAYAVIVAVLRPPQLVDSWHYMRGLG